jgi:hypothetical protein
MTTFQYRGCSLRKATALVATAVLCASAAHAKSTQSQSPVVQRAKLTCPNLTFAPPASDNRYVLLLLFKKDDAYLAGIQNVFNIPGKTAINPHPTGCIEDPDSVTARSKSYIMVQGGCPTDCVHPQQRIQDAYVPGDPLINLDPNSEDDLIPPNKKLGWAIFFADPAGGAEAADDDKQTTIRVYKILARDSCHAGLILKSLVNDPSHVFTPGGGYLGQIMIGYTPPPPQATQHRDPGDCKPWIAK